MTAVMTAALAVAAAAATPALARPDPLAVTVRALVAVRSAAAIPYGLLPLASRRRARPW
jgi:hypothetical protein